MLKFVEYFLVIATLSIGIVNVIRNITIASED